MKFLYMLDTNMVSYIVKGHSQAARARMLNMEDNEVVCLSAITEAEIRYGLAKRPEATALRERMEWFLLLAVRLCALDETPPRGRGAA
jgi:tRNA(fMet)-specific endonuclease VapC